MSENKGNQYTKPDNDPSEQHGETYNDIKKNSGEDIIQGAKQEDQLDGLKPDPKTKEKFDSQPPSHINQGDEGEKTGNG